MFVDALKRDAFFKGILSVFDNIGINKILTLCTFLRLLANKSYFVDVLYIFVRLSSNVCNFYVISINTNYVYIITCITFAKIDVGSEIC